MVSSPNNNYGYFIWFDNVVGWNYSNFENCSETLHYRFQINTLYTKLEYLKKLNIKFMPKQTSQAYN